VEIWEGKERRLEIDFGSLSQSDLVVDAVYKGGTAGNSGDDPVAKLLKLKAMGGIRFRGTVGRPSLVALTTSGRDLDWPDSLAEETGVLTYFGDNKKPGRELHDTPIHGNEVLRNLFDLAATPSGRAKMPPILVFMATRQGRDHRFLGLAVPGTNSASWSEELVGIWRSTEGLRYQNYRAFFTIVDTPVVPRSWLESVISGGPPSDVPSAWSGWVKTGVARALVAPRTRDARSRAEQEPTSEFNQKALRLVWSHFAGRPHDFEHFAAHLVKLYLRNASSIEVTRASRDGGRDAIGRYRVGQGPSGIEIDFAVEAKCYEPGRGVGVKELSRLISRLRHRQFGVLVTTSHLDRQAYSELKEDGHPIVVLAGGDILEILHRVGAIASGGLQSYLDLVAPAPGTR
jgi:hypothetical protein